MQTDLPDIPPLLTTLADQCSPLLAALEQPPLVVGIRTGGIWVAEEIMARNGLPGEPLELDIGFHRDDFGQRGLQRAMRPSRLTTTEGRDVLLVDDVLHSGRTIRAAMNALFEYGRPRCIRLAVLAARSGRELPIRPDAVAVHLDLPESRRIKLRKDPELTWQLQESGTP